MGKTARIEINPSIMLGKPVITGTRLTVELILRKLGEGSTIESILDGFPKLTKDDVQAALTCAAESLSREETMPVALKA